MSRHSVEAQLIKRLGTQKFVEIGLSKFPAPMLKEGIEPFILKEQQGLFEINANGHNALHYDAMHELNDGVQLLLNHPERFPQRRGETSLAFAGARKHHWSDMDNQLGRRGKMVLPRMIEHAIQLNQAQQLRQYNEISEEEYLTIAQFLEACMTTAIESMDENMNGSVADLHDYYERERGGGSCCRKGHSEFIGFDYYGTVIEPSFRNEAPYGYDAYDQPRLGPLFDSEY